MADIFDRLAAHLDTLPAGFPRTDSGVELRILRRLFSPEEAALALRLTVIPEEPRVVALRAKIPVEEATSRLEAMERRGLVMSTVAGGGPRRYMASQFVVGFWEGQVNRLSRDLVEDFEEYLPTLFSADTWRRTPQMRIVPVNESLPARGEVMPYEVVEELVRSGVRQYAVSNCICRQEMKILGKGCDRPMESCLSFGGAADLVTRSGRGRPANREEVLDILRRAEAAGLVLEASNSQQAVFICTCCGCCCAVLRSLKRHPKPATLVGAAFVAVLNEDTCNGCGACETRCQMEAVTLEDGRARLDVDRCIGCGLCVTTCPSESLTLRKSEGPHPVPKTIVDNYLQLGRARGHFGVTELVGLQLRSIIDRWRS